VLIWFVGGVLTGIVYVALLISEIGQFHPGADSHLRRVVFRKYLLRYALLAGGLVFAIQQDVRAGLALFAGFWIARWVGVYLGRSGRIDWSWFE
jgi:hypothetical protein